MNMCIMSPKFPLIEKLNLKKPVSSTGQVTPVCSELEQPVYLYYFIELF